MEKFFEKLLSRSGLILFTLGMIIILGGGYFYFQTQRNKEKQAGTNYNKIMNFLLTNQVDVNLSEFAKEKLTAVLPQLIELYQKYPDSNNGLRAALTIGNIYFELHDFEQAKKYYQIFKKKNKHYLSVHAFYAEAICEESQSNHAVAIEILSDLKTKYQDHFLFIDIVLAEARNYILQKDYDLALTLYNELLVNEDIARAGDQMIRKKITELNILKKIH